MKKALQLFIVTLLIFTLAACGKPGGSKDNGNQKNTGDGNQNTAVEGAELEPEEDAKLIVWGNGKDEAEWTKYVAEEFTKKYGIPVKFEEVSHTDAHGKLETDGPAGLGADVFTGAHDQIGNMEIAGLIYDNYYPQEYQERFMDVAVTGVSAKSDGENKVFGFPLAFETVGLYYNQDLLDEMGFKPATTMEEVIQQSKEFMSKNPKSYGFMIEPGNFYLIHGFIAGNGGYIFGDNNTNSQDIGLNNEGGLKAAQLMQEIRDEILPLKKEDITGDVISSLFNEGKLLYYVSGPWAVNGHNEAGVNFGVSTMPLLENGKVPVTFTGIKAHFVNAYSKYPKAAMLFAHFASTDEMLLKRYEMTGQIPPSKALIDNEDIKSNDINVAFLEQAKHSIPMPNIPEMAHVWGGMEVAYTAIWNGVSDPKSALDKGVQQIKDAIESQTK